MLVKPALTLPFFYGWLIVAIAFVTMAIGVTARTAYSLLMTPLMTEFGWDRALVAGAFSAGFVVSALLSPLTGRLVDRFGPRLVIECGVIVVAAGLFLAPAIRSPWLLYLSLGVLVGGGTNLMGFTVQALYLPNWFVRRRALAMGIAFAGVGVGALLLLPWLQLIIERDGWRASCRVLAWLVLIVIAPLNLLVRQRPAELGLLPDGDTADDSGGTRRAGSNIVDPAWAGVDWTLSRAVRTRRFWWLALGYFCALYTWYAVQVHQTTFLLERGFAPLVAATALSIVSVVAIPGQIGLGALSDRIGREWVWTIGCSGFALTYLLLLLIDQYASTTLMYAMVVTQGLLGYSIATILGPIAMEIFEGRHFGSIFGVLNMAVVGGAAAGPWVSGVIYDVSGSYRGAFALALCLCAVSVMCIWRAAPGKVRVVGNRRQAGDTAR